MCLISSACTFAPLEFGKRLDWVDKRFSCQKNIFDGLCSTRKTKNMIECKHVNDHL